MNGRNWVRSHERRADIAAYGLVGSYPPVSNKLELQPSSRNQSMITLVPHFDVDLTLYATKDGGRREPIAREGFACPCKLTKESDEISDCRLILKGVVISPGETKRVGIRFMRDEMASLFQSAAKFYLWDGRIIGEAKVSAG